MIMKMKFMALILMIVLASCNTETNQKKQVYVTRESFIDELIKNSEIEIKYFKEPKAHEYFNDVEDSSPYAMSLIIAADAGIIMPVSKKINGQNPIAFGEALEYIDKAYVFKTNNDSISIDIRKEIKAMDKKYEKMRSNDFIDEKLKKNMMDIVKSKLRSGIKSRNDVDINIEKDLKVYTCKSGNILTITLDWGRKSTGGYILKIIGVREVDIDTIEVTYYAKEPGINDIVTQVITYPKDSVNLKVEDINKKYNIVLKPQKK